MRQSLLFSKTRREAPQDEVAANANLLIKAGFIAKELSGVYSYLPLGWRTLQKINGIIRREMEKLGAEEVFLSVFQKRESWQTSGRYELPVWFKTKLANENEIGLGWTHEEAIATIARDHLRSYKDLPKAVYQIQTKFRNEERAKSGLLRGREFLMKDMYSFHADADDLDKFYEKVKNAYLNIFAAVGLENLTYVTVASGGAFSDWSHEFQTLAATGEDTIYLDPEKKLAVNKEIYNEKTLAAVGLQGRELIEKKSIEVGNIFKLGVRFSEPLGLNYLDEQSKNHPVIMGSYGLGPSRLLGTIAEVLSGPNELHWPEAIAPYKIHLLTIGKEENRETWEQAEEIYKILVASGQEVLFDDRQSSAGEKLADSDLLGLPHRLVISDRRQAKQEIEWLNRRLSETKIIKTVDLKNIFQA